VTTSAPSISALRTALGGRYSIERELGRGGMGAVYLARDLELDRPVALKVLPPEFALVPDLRERFLRETRTAASFSHPNIVPVFSIEDRDGLLAFAMGYVEGESVAQRVKRSGPLSVRELVRMLQDIGYALAYAHGRGVVHRDIKPDNIMLERATGRALLMDFGISRTITTQPAVQGLTRVGEVVGTPEFMSPEQAAGDELSGRSDLYSLGLVAWFAATGTLAISGDSTQKIIVRQITETIPPIGAQRGDLPTALSDAIDRCLRKDPDERFTNAEALVDTLDTAQLSAPDVPLPIRVFSEEVSTTGLMLIGGSVMSVLLYYALTVWFRWDLEVILPVVLFTAAVWARAPQTVQMARRLALRGFGVTEIQRGLAAIRDEHDADRAQLKADAQNVSRRRKQIGVLACLLVSTYAVEWYVINFQRTLMQPGVYRVSHPGVVMLYALNVTRGMSIIGLIRSPLRRPIGEWLFRWFWLGVPGRWLLKAAARRVPVSGSITRPVSMAAGVAVAPSVVIAGASLGTGATAHTSAVTAALGNASMDDRVRELERRVTTLEGR
jgi:eukaryotic-like serine/threonine-protein kinase